MIDLMSPWSPFQEAILKEHVIVDPKTGRRLPTIEAALVSKYATLVSPLRDREKKEIDAADFRRIARANYADVDRGALRSLASSIYEKAETEIEGFLEIAQEDRPFPI